MKTLCLLPVLTLMLWGADIKGKWTGNIAVADPSSGTTVNTPVKAEFDQQGNSVSGKIGRTEEDEPETIRNGKLDGNNLVFEVTSPETSGAMHFTLVVVSPDRIEGEMQGAIDIGRISGKVTLKKMP